MAPTMSPDMAASCPDHEPQPLSPPPGGGFVIDNDRGACVPVPPGARAGTTTAEFTDVWTMEEYWIFIKTQVAVDFQVAPPLKIRAVGGFNFPSAQYFGVEAIYLFTAR